MFFVFDPAVYLLRSKVRGFVGHPAKRAKDRTVTAADPFNANFAWMLSLGGLKKGTCATARD